MPEQDRSSGPDFVRRIVAGHVDSGRFGGRVHTRFPPEPNGYLHIGHAKAFLLSYAIAQENGGRFNLRFDDTNPSKEEQEYVDSIREDLRWFGVDWEDREFFASDHFEKLYEYAVDLVKKGRAYVDSVSAGEISRLRGTAIASDGPVETGAGEDSPFRDRPVEENLDLLERMKSGEFADGEHVLRAKIDMAHPNLNMRDPVMYRIQHAAHHRTGDDWCIYPTYDWAHGQSDSIEGITNSLCTLEFENHRPLYDWFIEQLGIHHPQQTEFAKFQMTHTMLSKRRLVEFVEQGIVNGWDDPRMPTLAGMRRRGYPPEAIRELLATVGVSKVESTVDFALLAHQVRDLLNRTAPRVMGVLRPLKLVIDGYPEGQVEEMELPNNPEDVSAGTRKVPFSRELWIELDDFMEDPPRKFFRLSPGREVRLRAAYLVTCTDVTRDSDGNVVEVRCSYDPESRGGDAPDGRKVKGTLHWVSAGQAIDAEVRLYDHMFTTEDPAEGGDWKANLNPDSFEQLSGCKLEPSIKGSTEMTRFQFERLGYFCIDKDSTDAKPVFNRILTLRDSWKKKQKK